MKCSKEIYLPCLAQCYIIHRHFKQLCVSNLKPQFKQEPHMQSNWKDSTSLEGTLWKVFLSNTGEIHERSWKIWLRTVGEPTSFSSLFLSSSYAAVWGGAGERAGRAPFCSAFPARGSAMSVHKHFYSYTSGAVVVQVILPRSHTGRLQLSRFSGGARVGTRGHVSSGLQRQQPDGSGCGIRAGILTHHRWLLQRPRHLHYQQ